MRDRLRPTEMAVLLFVVAAVALYLGTRNLSLTVGILALAMWHSIPWSGR